MNREGKRGLAKVVVEPIVPTLPALAVLLSESDALMARLYPDESNHLAGVDELTGSDTVLTGCYAGKVLVGCGALKLRSDDGEYGELKRVFVLAAYRGRGFSRRIVQRLEAQLLVHQRSVMRLETGIHQPEAIGLYKSMGYRERAPFGGYQADPLSVFMEKTVRQKE